MSMFFQKFLSFIFMVCLAISEALGIPLNGYEAKQLFADTEFKNGFSVLSQQTENNAGIKLGNFTYNNPSDEPSWMIAQWNGGNCLWAERTESDIYTLSDGVSKTVKFNPADNSVSMRLNAANIYKGMPADEANWPHLLLEQSPICDYPSLSAEDKAFYNCSAERMVLSLDIRLSDFADTTNKEGINACQYLAYVYLCGVEKNEFVWFGINLFDDRGYQDTYWALDKGSGNMIYSLSTKNPFGLGCRSLFRNGKPYVSDEWTHVEVDLAPHLDDFIQKANEADTFGREVSRDDFYIGGINIGFEIHGNYDCTVDIKEYNLTAYTK